jgi:NMD protein affecting ribosome stability and mRNA decay
MTRWFLVPLLLTAGCRSTTTYSPPNMGAAVVMRSEAVFAWAVHDSDRLVGYVVRFETGESRSKTYYSVRNEHLQELGMVDMDGRAWRYRAHRREPEWLGTGTVVKGARLVLETSDLATLTATDLTILSEKGANSNVR